MVPSSVELSVFLVGVNIEPRGERRGGGRGGGRRETTPELVLEVVGLEVMTGGRAKTIVVETIDAVKCVRARHPRIELKPRAYD